MEECLNARTSGCSDAVAVYHIKEKMGITQKVIDYIIENAYCIGCWYLENGEGNNFSVEGALTDLFYEHIDRFSNVIKFSTTC